MTTDFRQLARANVQHLQPYIPGKPVEEAQRELGLQSLIKLASNENPRGPSSKVLAAVSDALPETNRYPDGNGFYLKQALAERHNVSVDCITLGNGSNDILELVASVFLDRGTNAVYSAHAFAVYALAIARSGAQAVVAAAENYAHNLEAIAKAVTADTRVIYLANPNNPTGTYFSRQALTALLNQLPSSTMVVLDEAYFEYVSAADYPDGMELQGQFPNLIVARTFSKAYGLSGFRVGYAVSRPEVADLLNRVRQPFNVGSLSLVAAKAALADSAYIAESVAINRAGMQQLEQGFARLQCDFIPSMANFISFAPGFDAARVERLLLEKGVIVRGIDSYQMSDYLRVSIGVERENKVFLEQLENTLSELGA